MNLRTENKRETLKQLLLSGLLSDFQSDFISELSLKSSICVPKSKEIDKKISEKN